MGVRPQAATTRPLGRVATRAGEDDRPLRAAGVVDECLKSSGRLAAQLALKVQYDAAGGDPDHGDGRDRAGPPGGRERPSTSDQTVPATRPCPEFWRRAPPITWWPIPRAFCWPLLIVGPARQVGVIADRPEAALGPDTVEPACEAVGVAVLNRSLILVGRLGVSRLLDRLLGGRFGGIHRPGHDDPDQGEVHGGCDGGGRRGVDLRRGGRNHDLVGHRKVRPEDGEQGQQEEARGAEGSLEVSRVGQRTELQGKGSRGRIRSVRTRSGVADTCRRSSVDRP